MPTVNQYFQSGRSIGARSEQNLYEDLIIEALKIYGFEVYYMPRTPSNEDLILTEDPTNQFKYAYPIEMYLETNMGFQGESEILTKFGLEIRDSVTLVVARKRWNSVIGSTGNAFLPRPSEGDVIFLPLNKGFFEIRKVENLQPFYQVGKLYVYTLYCELMQYSNERFNTGVSEIDQLAAGFDLSIDNHEVLLENGDILLTESHELTPMILEEYHEDLPAVESDNQKFQAEVDSILDFSEKNPFGDV